ncbi:MAG: AgmX/PglI C-terminal domain-containing protein [Bradymonadia bacterium]
MSDPKARVAEALAAVGLDTPAEDELSLTADPGAPVEGVDADLFALHAMGLTDADEGRMVSQALVADPDRGLDLAEARASGDIRISQDMPVVRPQGTPAPVNPEPQPAAAGAAATAGSEAALTGQRREQSTLFSLDELDAMTEADSKAPDQSLNEPSGLVNLNTLHAAQLAPGPTLVSALPEPARKSSPMMMIIAAVLLLGAGGAGVYFWLQSQKNDNGGTQVASNSNGPVASQANTPASPLPVEQPKPAAAAAKPAPADAGAPPPDAATPDAAAPDAAVQVAMAAKPARRARRRSRPAAPTAAPKAAAPAPAPAGEPARTPVAAAKPKSNDTEVDDILGNLEGNRRSPARSKKSSEDDALANDPLLPEKLSRAQILGVVRKEAPKIRQCKSRAPGVSGVAKVKVVIGRSGKISSASLLDGPVKGTPVGDCVEKSVKSFRFDKFRGDPVTVTLPFAL